VAEVCRKAGISDATFYGWRKKYAGLMPSEMKRLRVLEEENGKLKKLVVDLSLDKALLQDVLSQKLCSLRGGARWSTNSVAPGRSRSGEPAACYGRRHRPTTTRASAARRPHP
jgi:putative transposase